MQGEKPDDDYQETDTTYNGFAIPLQPDTDLGLAMLIAESEDGRHEPVAVVGTISEAREAARAISATGCAGWSGARTLAFARRCTKSGPAGLTAATAPRARSPTSSSPPRIPLTRRLATGGVFFGPLRSPSTLFALGRRHPDASATPTLRRGSNVGQMWRTGGQPSARFSSRNSADQSASARHSPFTSG